ncbi:MAG TPA: vWA domain-containing protein [Gaiellaceae bacterium]|nr:vWA domain-containing protein [Gaiellaceae bacterium]
MVAAIVFLSPLAGLAALAALLPLAGFVLAARRVRATRALLELHPPSRTSRVPKAFALVAVPALLGLAAAQPALRRPETARVRTDAEAMFVLDISRSMRAAKGPASATRLARAKRDAIAIRAALPEVPSGVATFTDRVLPALLPSPDPATFDGTVQRAVAIEQPPPSGVDVTSTTLGALSVLGIGNYFPAAIRKRLAVVLTDGESRPYDLGALGRVLAAGPGVKLVLVHVSAPGEAVFDGRLREQGYHEDASSGAALTNLATATHGVAVGEDRIGAAIRAAKADLGSGPTPSLTRVERTRPLAPWVAVAALAVLTCLAVAGERGTVRWMRRRGRARRAVPDPARA